MRHRASAFVITIAVGVAACGADPVHQTLNPTPPAPTAVETTSPSPTATPTTTTPPQASTPSAIPASTAPVEAPIAYEALIGTRWVIAINGKVTPVDQTDPASVEFSDRGWTAANSRCSATFELHPRDDGLYHSQQIGSCNAGTSLPPDFIGRIAGAQNHRAALLADGRLVLRDATGLQLILNPT